MSTMRYEVSRWLLAAMIVLGMSSYFIGYQPLENVVVEIGNGFVIIVAFALTLGAINLIIRNVKNIERKADEWYFSVWVLFCVAVTTVLGVFFGPTNSMYTYLYDNIYLPAGATIYSITALFIASAVYRAFRIRNVESFLLLVCSVFVMLKNAPVGEMISPYIPLVGRWLSDYPQSSGNRIIWIIATIGWLALCVRYVFGRERVIAAE